MANQDAKQKLVNFLDEKAFQPVLRAKPEDFRRAKGTSSRMFSG